MIKKSEILLKLKKSEDEIQRLNEEKTRLKNEIEALSQKVSSMFAECPQCGYTKPNNVAHSSVE